MAEERFTVVGPWEAYDTKPGDVVTLDAADPAVRANLAAGVIKPEEGGSSKPEKRACPACAETGNKRPPKFDSAAALAKHYGDKHPALVVPTWEEEV